MRHCFRQILLTFFAGLTLATNPAWGQKTSPPDYTRDVRPILARYCFKCHGPDERTLKAKLRLDVPIRPDDPVLTPGHPEKSELVARILSTDRASVMPPSGTKLELTSKQKDVLRRWIASGAKFERHWAFQVPKEVALPPVKNAAWPRNPIDRFILSRLDTEGLKPSPPADRTTLIRRVSLDLIGLPPTPAEVDAFVNDTSKTAYEKVVDRLLASPRYGERWARRWLDLARYADTNGYEKDRPRSIWPYRDWVIQAMNDDMPFNEFTIQQIAGDLLPGASASQVIATGFHRNTMVNEEGGIDPLEFRYYAVVDRLNTTATTWLGLTFSCAQCHSHKYDPISQREYFQMLAFLNNADEPDFAVPNAGIAKRRREIETKIAKLSSELAERFPGGRPALERRFAEWAVGESAKAVKWEAFPPSAMSSNKAFLNLLPGDQSILVGGDQTKSDTYTLRFANKVRAVTALRLEALPDPSLPDRGPGRTYYEGRKGDFFLSELSLHVSGKKVAFRGATHDHANAAFGAAKVGAHFCYDGDPSSGWSTTDQPGKAHEAVFQFAQPTDFEGDATLTLLFERHYACGLGRFRISVTTDPRPAVATSHGADITHILATPSEQRSAQDRQNLLTRFLDVAPELADVRQEIEKLRSTLPTYASTMVMKERPPAHPRPTHLHHRGEYLQPKEEVAPGVAAALHPFPKGEKRDRLGFARWLVTPESPLTARVTVNRQWQAFFGRGIVRTLEDFGLQGDLPTHPELLDWLAREFVHPTDGGRAWSLKRLHKMIVLSATYQQSSWISPESLKRDPENALLARGPRHRLEAELIRDEILAVSGLLSPKIGGPSVFPPQPASVTTEGVYGALPWKVSSGEDRYRRGLYTFLKRSIPYAMFSTFDGATGETCLARRETSNTPLQALTMLNDVVIVEAAQALGRATAGMPGSVEERMSHLFRRCLCRTPNKGEREILVAFYHKQHERIRVNKLDAAAIAGGPGVDALQRAAWTLTARAILNLDEMITKE